MDLTDPNTFHNHKPFTGDEENIMQLIAMLHETFNLLPVQHEADKVEWVNAIHELQGVMMRRPVRRPVRRDYPNYFTHC